MLLVGIVCLAVDPSVAHWLASTKFRGDIRKLFTYSEVFGHGLGVALIILTATVLDSRGPGIALYLGLHAYSGGILAALVKLVIGRSRPYFAATLPTDSIQDTFVGWFPALTVDSYQGWLDARMASFPSAHAATAAGLALGLTRLYPKGRWMFALFAVLAGAQRCFAQAHFTSDVVVGLAIGLAIACQWPATFDAFQAALRKWPKK